VQSLTGLGGWVKGTKAETHDGGDNYVQMGDDERLACAFVVPNGDQVWMESVRHAAGATLTLRDGQRGEVLYTQELKTKGRNGALRERQPV
jgi:hypothetical protein